MKQIDAERIESAAQELGLDVTVHPTYSGRGMYGAQTWAVSGDLEDVVDAMAEAGVRVSGHRRDQLGRGIVIY